MRKGLPRSIRISSGASCCRKSPVLPRRAGKEDTPRSSTAPSIFFDPQPLQDRLDPFKIIVNQGDIFLLNGKLPATPDRCRIPVDADQLSISVLSACRIPSECPPPPSVPSTYQSFRPQGSASHGAFLGRAPERARAVVIYPKLRQFGKRFFVILVSAVVIFFPAFFRPDFRLVITPMINGFLHGADVVPQPLRQENPALLVPLASRRRSQTAYA